MNNAETEVFLSCENVSKAWKGRPFLQNISLRVNRNERLAILGASGAGKSTLLRVIAGLENGGGTILLEGCPIPEYARMENPVGMVFQRPAVYPHLSVRENLSFPLEQRKKSKPEIAERTRHLAALLDLSALLDRPASVLSGGEMQRVAIGRTLAFPPKLLLLDEPFANLHQTLRWRMVDYVRRLHLECALTTILVTHEPGDAMYFADRIAVMSAGKILQHGNVLDVLKAPASAEIAQLLFDPPPNQIMLNSSPLGNGIAVWKPADTRVHNASEPPPDHSLSLTGRVCDTGHYLEQILVSIDVGGVIVRALVPFDCRPAVGVTVGLSIENEKLHFFKST